MAETKSRKREIRHVRLGDIATLMTGYPTYRLRGDAGAMVLIVSVKDLENASNPSWQLSSISVPDFNRIENFRLQPGDVIITARGASLKSALVPERWSGAVLSSNLIAVRLLEQLYPELLVAFLQSLKGQRAIERRLKKTGLLNITLKELGEIEVPVPPKEDQQELVELIRLDETQYSEAIHAAELRRSLVRSIVLERLLG